MSSTVTSWSPDTNTKASETTSSALNNATLSGTLAVTGVISPTTHIDMPDSANIKLGTGDDLQLYHDGSHSYITNAVGTLKLATETSGIAVTIGHTTSEVTIADNLTVTGTLTLGSGAELTEAELEMLDGITAGTVIASKAIVTDSNIDITGGRNITISGELDAATLDISGNVDIDGTTNLDAVDIDGAVQLDNTFTIGVDDTGYDVKFFGATSGKYMLWDEDQNDLILVADNVTLNASGNLTIPGLFVGKTYSEIPMSSYEANATSGSQYYMDIGLSQHSSTSDSSSIALSRFAMNDLAIKRIKVGFSGAIANLTTAELRLKKYDGSGDIEELATAVGTTWTITSSDISDDAMFYHAPSDWVIEKGEKWGITLEITVSTGSIAIRLNGNMLIENDYSDLISS